MVDDFDIGVAAYWQGKDRNRGGATLLYLKGWDAAEKLASNMTLEEQHRRAERFADDSN